MKKQKKQSLLNGIIIILVLALIMMVASIVYEEKTNMSKQPTQNTGAPTINEDEEDENEELKENDNTEVKEEQDSKTDNKEELPVEDDKDEEYVGEEENTTEEPEISTDEKVIDLVKKEWGKDDSVTFTIEKKNGTKYRVAVRDSSTTVLQWYEVNTETWKVSEY